MSEKQNRQSNYDLLRIFATIAVIIIHANFHFFVDRFETPDLSPEFITENLLNIITRFSVPVFIMLSGGFNLNNPGNGNAVSFYKKTTWKIVLPTVIIAFIFMLIFFKNINVKADLSYPSRLTFYIYLFHSITLNLVYFIIEKFITAQVNELILIAAATISTLILSLIPAAAADHIWRRQTKLKDKWYGAKFWKAI